MAVTRDNDGRGKNGRYIRTIDSARRDADAASRRAAGMSYRQIAEAMGYENESGAYKAVQRALAATVAEPAGELRQLEVTRLDAMLLDVMAARDRVMAVLEREHYVVSEGRVVRKDGKDSDPLEDDEFILKCIDRLYAANDRLLRIQDRRSKLLGLDAPVQAQVAVTELTQADIGLAELVAEAKAANAVALAELREQA